MSFDLTAHLRLVDHATRPLRAMASALGGAVTQVGVFGAAMLGMQGAMTVTNAAISSFKKAMSFEAQMSTIAALTGASADEMAKMQTLALKMGAATKYSALEAGQGIEELLKAGLSPAAVQAGGLEAALNLATAGGLGLAEAAETMATSLNAFKKDNMSAAEASDILAGTANVAATSVSGLGFALASAGGVADMIGLSFKDFNTAIGLMSNDGLKNGSDAGTSFKSMLMYLQPQTKEATKLFNKLGIGVGKANKFFKDGKLRSLSEVAQVLNDTLKDMSEQKRTRVLMEMFGTDGVKAAATLYKAGAKGVKEFKSEMSNVTALDVAKKKMDNAAGAVEQFSGAIETLQISALLPTMPLIKDFALGAADLVEKYTPQITAAVQDMTDKVRNYIKTHYTDNPEFQKLTTFGSKVDFIFNDVTTTFNTWWGSTGRSKLEEISASVTRSMIDVMAELAPEFAEVGIKIGSAIISGMRQGLKDSVLGQISDFMTPFWLDDIYSGEKNFGDIALDYMIPDWFPYIGHLGNPEDKANISGVGGNFVNSPFSDTYSKSVFGKQANFGGTQFQPTNPPKGGNQIPDYLRPGSPFKNPNNHSGGIARVPYNGYPAILHRDEAVLHRAEARNWREGSGGNGVTITGNTFNVRKNSDISDIAAQLYRLINDANNAMGAR